MKTDKPAHGSGKTKYNRLKGYGKSWTALRDRAVAARQQARSIQKGVTDEVQKKAGGN